MAVIHVFVWSALALHAPNSLFRTDRSGVEILSGRLSRFRRATPRCTRAENIYAAAGPIAVAEPSLSLGPADVVEACMNALVRNDFPEVDSGLATCFAFSNDMCRAAVGGSLDDFCKYAKNPTFQTLVNCRVWRAEPVNFIGGGATPTRGAMATQTVIVTSRTGSTRAFLWTLQQERRPPLAGAWLVWQCLAKDSAIDLTL
jgi:hypothetical protein